MVQYGIVTKNDTFDDGSGWPGFACCPAAANSRPARIRPLDMVRTTRPASR